MEKLAEEEQKKSQEHLGPKKSLKRFSWKRKSTKPAGIGAPGAEPDRNGCASRGYRLYHLSRSTAATMPTPESESFKAAKPTVPPTFDGVDYDDNKQLKAAQDSIIREQWVQSMMARLIREEMGKCYYKEGVNHLEKCGHLRERYLQQLKHSKIKGYLFEQQNYVSEK
ncbi:hypothetical protein KC363_g665 [Hortaea werneckii]|nr:hypothetical protein KC361_g3559 [Hortaea werneckii]KAI6885732.1 hypothetical protein KC325_g3360 [Hortaea werneckii]KAI6995157.1 hypothetical protein KC359_g4256 [Hortaea werneckii]KAI7147167.1 hypothetical protein KC344_g3035 [Hortaea werneckii]KAI7175781.1 hypothetical protein KC360_g3458 [Hortaea werneckii]